MKIKKIGRIPQLNLDVKCNNCEAVITLDSACDISVVELGSNKKLLHYSICPVCGHVITVPSADIPKNIREAADWS